MKLNRLELFLAAVWLSLAIVFGLISRSLLTAATILGIGAFTLAPVLLKPWLGSGSRIKALAGKAMGVVWMLVWAFIVVSGAERMYWAHADSYPLWLTKGELPAGTDLGSLRHGECKDMGPIEITQKDDGTYFLRCGFMLPSRLIYHTTTSPLKDIAGSS